MKKTLKKLLILASMILPVALSFYAVAADDTNIGQEGGACTEQGTCDNGLHCENSVCAINQNNDTSVDVIYDGSGKTLRDHYCKVVEPLDIITYNSFRRAVQNFNGSSRSQMCKSHIDFDVAGIRDLDPITLRETIRIHGTNHSLVSAGGSKVFIVGPSKMADPGTDLVPIEIDEDVFYGLNARDEEQLLENFDINNENCVIRIDTNDTVLQNVIIDGQRNNTSYKNLHGVCVNATGVTLKNVIVKNMSGAGIFFTSSARNPRFEGNYGKALFNKYGIISKSPDILLNHNTFVAIGNGEIANSNYTGNGQNYFFSTSQKVSIPYDQITVSRAKYRGENVYRVSGKVLACSGFDDCSGASGVQIETIQIHAEEIGGRFDFVNNSELNTYVGDAKKEEITGHGDRGDFKIYIDTSNYNNHRFYLVPVLRDGTIGSSSPLFNPKFISIAEEDVEPESEASIYAANPQECDRKMGNPPSFTDFIADSDMDGIRDYVEMSIRRNGTVGEPTCNCSITLSCWHSADYAGNQKDGILDIYEFLCMKARRDDNGELNILATYALDPYEPMTCLQKAQYDGLVDEDTGSDEDTGTIVYEPLDTDNDGEPDIIDRDNDGDGLPDFVENRKYFYNRNRMAYFHPLGTPDKFQIAGKTFPCYDYKISGDGVNADTSRYDPEIGIGWGIYIIDRINKTVTPVSSVDEIRNMRIEGSDDSEDDNAGKSVMMLECRNAILEPGLDLDYSPNANQKENDSSNFMKKDSDGDATTTVDDVESVDANFLDGKDPCPWNPDKSCKVRGCQPNDILYSINDYNQAYLRYKDGRPDGFVMSEDGTVPELFANIKTIDGARRIVDVCPDSMDRDGIPDCLELYISREGNLSECVVGENVLDPHSVDSDGDADTDADGIPDDETLFDAHDPCPFDATNTCNLHSIYEGREFLAFFMDRDSDGLYDIEEYFSKDLVEYEYADMRTVLNQRPNIQTSNKFTPTDPLKDDTDGDGVKDYYEVRIFGTMPGQQNSDGDGLSDYQEVNRDGDATTLSVALGNYSCVGAGNDSMNIDTDPNNPDTDGDGLNDDIEINLVGTSAHDADSDNDGLCDGIKVVEGVCELNPGAGRPYGGHELMNIPGRAVISVEEDWWSEMESDPCNPNTDGDDRADGEEEHGCRSNEGVCQGSGYTSDGIRDEDDYARGDDTDNDGLPDSMEAIFDCEIGNPDSDDDGLVDGCIGGEGELCVLKARDWVNAGSGNTFGTCTEDFKDCDTDPTDEDSDDDGLNDRMERRYGTNPWDQDTDNDCLLDGMEDENKNGKWDPDETRAASAMSTQVIDGIERTDMFDAIDTDGDGLPDGKHARYNNLGWEDENCNGIVDMNSYGKPETDPRNPDSDGDRISDKDEMYDRWGFNADRSNEATAKRGYGCSVAGNGQTNIDMILIFAALLIGVAFLKRRLNRPKTIR